MLDLLQVQSLCTWRALLIPKRASEVRSHHGFLLPRWLPRQSGMLRVVPLGFGVAREVVVLGRGTHDLRVKTGCPPALHSRADFDSDWEEATRRTGFRTLFGAMEGGLYRD